ncbi:hypothetical protein V1281_006954 [Nitrobacteraceae bacterium AZCC 2161]
MSAIPQPLSEHHDEFRLRARTRSEKRVQAAKNRAKKNDEAIAKGSEGVKEAYKAAVEAQAAAFEADGKSTINPKKAAWAVELDEALVLAIKQGPVRVVAEKKAHTETKAKLIAANSGATPEAIEIAARKAAKKAGKVASLLTPRQRSIINRAEFADHEERLYREEHSDEAAKMAYALAIDAGADEESAKERAEEAREHSKTEAPRQTARDRIFDRGFAWPGGWVAGKWLQAKPFFEKGFRSHEEPMLEKFVSAVPKASVGINAGNGNGSAREIHNIKWRALDKTHVAVNMVYRTFWRIELDADFKSYEHLRLKLEMMVKDGVMPCLPHIIDWIPSDTLPQGTCNHPHLWFTLPEGAGVYGKGNVSDRMMRGVIAALTAALAPLGADPGGLANPHDGKNPLCPNAQYRIPNDAHLPRLEEYAETLDVSIDTDSMARIMSIRTLERTNVGKRSQQMYDWIYSASTTIAAELHKKGIVDANDPSFDRYRFGEIVDSELKRRARIEFPELSGAELEAMLKVCSTKATWAAEKFDVTTLSGGVNRGAIRDQIEETDTLAEKQGKGGTYSRQKVKNDNINLIGKAMVIDVKRDRAPDIDLLAKATGLHPKTVKTHYSAALKVAQGIVHHYAVDIISIALTPILQGKEASLGKGCTMTSPASHGEATANQTCGQPSEADPASGDPGQPPNCSFEAFVDAHHRSRCDATSATVH